MAVVFWPLTFDLLADTALTTRTHLQFFGPGVLETACALIVASNVRLISVVGAETMLGADEVHSSVFFTWSAQNYEKLGKVVGNPSICLCLARNS
eukprot:6487932-Amphidinium_carterae.1